jgi:hypothetical protein
MKKFKSHRPNLVGPLAHNSTRRLAQHACGPRPHRVGPAQRPVGTSRCWRRSHASFKAARGTAPVARGCGQVTLGGGLGMARQWIDCTWGEHDGDLTGVQAGCRRRSGRAHGSSYNALARRPVRGKKEMEGERREAAAPDIRKGGRRLIDSEEDRCFGSLSGYDLDGDDMWGGRKEVSAAAEER